MQKVTEPDTGTDVFTLVRVSHIHLFGITFIFFMMGTIFSHAYVRPVWFKCTVMAMPFVGLGRHILLVLHQALSSVRLCGDDRGGVMGLSFAYMWVVCMYQMWFARRRQPSRRERAAICPPSTDAGMARG